MQRGCALWFMLPRSWVPRFWGSRGPIGQATVDPQQNPLDFHRTGDRRAPPRGPRYRNSAALGRPCAAPVSPPSPVPTDCRAGLLQPSLEVLQADMMSHSQVKPHAMPCRGQSRDGAATPSAVQTRTCAGPLARELRVWPPKPLLRTSECSATPGGRFLSWRWPACSWPLAPHSVPARAAPARVSRLQAARGCFRLPIIYARPH